MTHTPMECPDCGAKLTSEEEFVARSDMICDAVDEADPLLEFTLLAQAAGRFLASAPAEHRKEIRRRLIEAVDMVTRHYVIAACDA